MKAICAERVKVALIGGSPGSAEAAKAALMTQNRSLNVLGIEPVPRHELVDSRSRQALIERISDLDADFYFIGLGVPRQESLALELMDEIESGVIMCVGAAIEFEAGNLNRAPQFVRDMRLEWLHRLVCEPRKLLKRYVFSSVFFFRVSMGVLAKDLIARRTSRNRRRRDSSVGGV
jgi:exopolysaccharide biosynthesis WecB/TagA/CpsF family protein